MIVLMPIVGCIGHIPKPASAKMPEKRNSSARFGSEPASKSVKALTAPNRAHQPDDRFADQTPEVRLRACPQQRGNSRTERRDAEVAVVQDGEAADEEQPSRRLRPRTIELPRDEPQEHERPEVPQREDAEEIDEGVAVLERAPHREEARREERQEEQKTPQGAASDAPEGGVRRQHAPGVER
jgi:hypothetical protein